MTGENSLHGRMSTLDKNGDSYHLIDVRLDNGRNIEFADVLSYSEYWLELTFGDRVEWINTQHLVSVNLVTL